MSSSAAAWYIGLSSKCPPSARTCSRELAAEDVEPRAAPAFRLPPVEEQAGMQERFRVRQQVIAEQVVFETAAEPARLHGQARVTPADSGLPRSGPFHPVHDAA